MKLKRKIAFSLIGCFVLALPLLPLQAETVEALSEKVEKLQQVNDKNNRDVARAINLLTQIQQEFQSIRGQVDASRFLTQESDRVYRDLDLRVSALEDKIDQIHRLLKEIAINQKSGAPIKPSASSVKEVEDYQALILLVNNRDYRTAASGFLGFLKKYPKSSFAPRALYWVGESYYSMSDYSRAIKEFQKLVSRYPEDPRVKEAIYKQGMAFSRLKKYNEAKLFFQKVMANYPNTAAAAKSQTRLHWIEEMEKNQVALGEGSKDKAPKTTGKEPGEPSADRPIYKITPMTPPKSKPKTPPAEGEAGMEGEDKEPSAPAPPSSGKDSAPLF